MISANEPDKNDSVKTSSTSFHDCTMLFKIESVTVEVFVVITAAGRRSNGDTEPENEASDSSGT